MAADRYRTLASLVAVAALAVACSTEDAGVPLAQPPSSTSATTSTSRATSTTLPVRPRPRQLLVADVQPCDLLAADQQRRFGIDTAPSPDDDPSLQAMTCDFISHAQKIAIAVSPLTNFGIDRFQPGKVNGEVRSLTVRTFPAVEVFTETIETIDMFCVVVVDVADKQAVHVSYSENGVRPHLGRSVVCERAAQVADAVVGNLLAR